MIRTGTISTIRKHMPVLGSAGARLGTVDSDRGRGH
jgi:hypothetical protein